MITLTTVQDEPFILNSDLIETIYEKPDTTLRLTNGNVMLVKESKDDIVQKVIAFRQQCAAEYLKGKFQ